MGGEVPNPETVEMLNKFFPKSTHGCARCAGWNHNLTLGGACPDCGRAILVEACTCASYYDKESWHMDVFCPIHGDPDA